MMPLLESASGRIAFKGSLTGAMNKPVYSFEISDVRANPLTASSWEPVSIGLADFRPPLKNIRLKANLKNGLLNIESLTASKGAGRIDGAGTFVFGIMVEAVVLLRKIHTRDSHARAKKARRASWRLQDKVLYAFVLAVQVTLGYFAMLMVMTYSAIIFNALVLGIVAGHVLFNVPVAAESSEFTSSDPCCQYMDTYALEAGPQQGTQTPYKL